ncbi:unnamed protein product, partial [Ectocarpus sp. 12 AP-2014]
GGGLVSDGPADGEKGGGASLDNDRGVARLGRRTPPGAGGDTLVGEGEGCGDVGGQVGRGAVSPDSCSGNAGDGGEGPGSQRSGSRDARTESSSSSARWDSGRSDNGAGEGDGEMIDEAEDEEGRKGTHREALSRSLFDEILDQNAIPTIRQNIVPKFIQSSYYEIFLAELFPQVETPDINASDGNEFRLAHLKSDNTSMTLDESDGGPSRQYRTNSLEEVRDNPEALAARIAQAVAAARKVAEDAAVAASAAAAVAAEVAEGGRGKDPAAAAVEASDSALEVARGQERLLTLDEARSVNDGAVTGLRFAEGDDGTDHFGEEEDFSDELLVVIGFRKGGLVRRVSTG